MFKCVVATPIAMLVFRNKNKNKIKIELFGSDLSTRIELISTKWGASLTIWNICLSSLNSTRKTMYLPSFIGLNVCHFELMTSGVGAKRLWARFCNWIKSRMIKI